MINVFPTATTGYNYEQIHAESLIGKDEYIEAPQKLITIADGVDRQRLFTRSNLSTIKGKPKAGKSFVMSILASVGECDSWEGKLQNEGIKSLTYYDTEQAKYDSVWIRERIKKMAGKYNRTSIINLRKYAKDVRREFIYENIKKSGSDLYIVDGITDICSNFNNLEASEDIVNEMMSLSEQYECHICCVIHENVDGKARGHLGTAFENKSETVIKLVSNKERGVIEVSNPYARGRKAFADFEFYIEEGLPVLEMGDYSPF